MAGRFRILGLGDNTVDTYVDLGLQFPGGNAVNVAVLAKRIGADAAYLGCLGNDAAGDLVRSALVAEGVEIARCRDIEGPNAQAFIAHNDGDRRFVKSSPGVRGRWGEFSAEDLAYVASFDLVHSSIYSELGDDLGTIKAAARVLSFDFSERWTDDNLKRILPQLDIAFLSWPSASDDECRALAADCMAKGPRMVVITRGKRGALALSNGVVHTCGIAPAVVVDTLGAGDGFIAAFLLSLLGGAVIPAALAAGASHAATVCGYRGAFGHGVAWISHEHPDAVH